MIKLPGIFIRNKTQFSFFLIVISAIFAKNYYQSSIIKISVLKQLSLFSSELVDYTITNCLILHLQHKVLHYYEVQHQVSKKSSAYTYTVYDTFVRGGAVRMGTVNFIYLET